MKMETFTLTKTIYISFNFRHTSRTAEGGGWLGYSPTTFIAGIYFLELQASSDGQNMDFTT